MAKIILDDGTELEYRQNDLLCWWIKCQHCDGTNRIVLSLTREIMPKEDSSDAP